MQTIDQGVHFTAKARAADFPLAWCVAEYSVIDETTGLPPTVMMILAVKLRDVFTMADVGRNSEWRKCIQPDHAIMVRVLIIGDKMECTKEAGRRVLSANPRPRCNMYGFDSFALIRPILCSNGETYTNQVDAARALGLNQGAISRNLRGLLKSVSGYTFTYKD